MESFFTPYSARTHLPAESLLVLAPHPDDEVFGCGGSLAAAVDSGNAVQVVVMSRQADDDIARQREEESRQAAQVIGYPPPAFEAFTDGCLQDAPDALRDCIGRWLRDVAPTMVLCPSPWEMHRDHRAVAAAALQALGRVPEHLRPTLCFYEVGVPLRPDLLVDITPVQARKQAGMACFPSQLAQQRYAEQIDGLNAFRSYTLPRDIKAVEAFRQVVAADLEAWREAVPHDTTLALQEAGRQLARAVQERDGVAAQLAALREELAAMQRSRSWRLTAPLRRLTGALRASRHMLRELPPALRHGAVSLIRNLQQRAHELATSRNHQHCRQAVLERRLATLDLPSGGWRKACQSLPTSATSATSATSDLPLITVSVVTYNSAGWLPPMLQSLLEQRYPLDRMHLVFVDNGSQDDSLAILQHFRDQHAGSFHQVAVHELPNPGFGAAHNHAVRHSSGEFVLVTNPDLQFLPESVTRVVAMALADTDDVASWELRQAPHEHPKHYDPVSWETLWSSHACILLRRSVLESLGGYDERLFLYGEDVEFSFRCREAGLRLRYCPLATVLHHTYAETNEIKPAQYVGSKRANLFLRLRYGSRRDVLAGLLLSIASLRRSPFPGARRQLVAAYRSLLGHAARLRREYRRSPCQYAGIFRGFDYEMIRTGAFVAISPLPAESTALPLVSVITRTYKGREWLLQQAGRSVFQQTWPNLEWIVVEDGGEACKPAVQALAAQAPCSVRYASQAKLGRSRAGNLGLSMARGRWCLILDDDDLLYADHLETLASAMLADPSLAAAYSLAWDVSCDIDHDAQTLRERAYLQHTAHRQAFDREELAWRNYIPIQSLLFERRLFETHGGLHEHLDQLEDWNLWRRFAQGERFQLVARTTSLYRTPACPRVWQARQAALDEAYQRVKEETDAELAAGDGA